ncbi:MAG: T9SS type A sorting domain-containing protein [Bacteroidetes bacterium]|nr:T9SS type A sorting domain-containing protein [Bacteroidota bacterium]
MMKKIIILITLFSIYYTNSKAQCSFIKELATGNSTWGFDVIELSDSSIIVSGRINLGQGQNQIGFLAKFEPCGDTIWTLPYINKFGGIVNIEQFDSNNIVAFSFIFDTINQAISSFNLIDKNNGNYCCVNSPFKSQNGGKFRQARRSPRGNYLLTIHPFFDPVHAISILDSNLNLKYYTNASTCCTNAPIEDPEGYIYAASSTGAQFPNYRIEKFDSTLTLQWQYDYGNIPYPTNLGYFLNYDIAFSADTNLLISTAGDDYQLLKVNRYTGDTIWSRYYPDSNLWHDHSDIWYMTRTKKNVLTAIMDYGMTVAALDELGNIIWKTPNLGMEIRSIQPTLEGGVIAVGTRGNPSKMTVAKIDSGGNMVFTSEYELPKQIKVMSIYPNPSDDKITIKAQALEGRDVMVTVYDAKGSRMFERMWFDENEKYFAIDIDCVNWNKGLYVVTIQTEKEYLKGKFVKQ